MLRAGQIGAAVFVLAVAGGTAHAQAPAQDALPEVLISRQLSETFGLEPGETARFSFEQSGANPREYRVAGIFEPAPDPMELNSSRYEVRLHLPDLMALANDPADPLSAEAVDGISVTLVNPAEAGTFSADLSARVPGVFARPANQANYAGTFVVLERFHLAIAAVTIIASTVFLLALTVMLVDERRETVGILRLIGLTSRRVLIQVLLEGLLIAAGGAAFGLLLALSSESLINRYFQWHYDTTITFVRVTPEVWFKCLLIAVPLGAGASVTASWSLLRKHVLTLARR